MLCKEIKNYISTAQGFPFFYIVGDKEYSDILDELKQLGISSIVRLSDFCPQNDKLPSIDELVDHLLTSDMDYRDNKVVVVGVGEYLSLRGDNFANNQLLRLKNTTLGNTRAIFLLRGIAAQAKKIIKDDPRMFEQQRAYIANDTSTNITITNIVIADNTMPCEGMKWLIQRLEDGVAGQIFANTSLQFNESLFPVSVMSDAFSVIKLKLKNETLCNKWGTERQWSRLLKDIDKYSCNLDDVFTLYDIDEKRIFDNLNSEISGYEYRNWLVFLYLKLNVNQSSNPYFKYVLDKTEQFEEFKNNLLLSIIEISHKNKAFRQLYDGRKKLLKDFSEADIATFVNANKINGAESIYNLTDNTLLEKKEIVKWVAHYGITDALYYVYPDLNDYLKKYFFATNVLSDELTEYFDMYKQLKVTNKISDEFIEMVIKHATEISYAKLPTRDNAIKAIEDKERTCLYWIDALGVEYLSYIIALANTKGLSIKVDIVRSDLPTITSINKQFYDQWPDGKKFKEERLDEIKHKDKGSYFFTDNEDPIHLPKELEIIKETINNIAVDLNKHKYKSFVIASDHGASRLAVIRKQEVSYDTDTKGEHSGRCCKVFDGCNVPYMVEENGFIVLSDYGRFRGSRAANVEVHGGATLEEIVVPVITLTLKKTYAKIQVMHPNDIIADRHVGVMLELYISNVEDANNMTIHIDGKMYRGRMLDETHYVFELKDIKRTKSVPYTADVFDGDSLIGSTSFNVIGKAAIVKDEFNFGDDF